MMIKNVNGPMPTSGGSETERELFSEHKVQFIEDLECLYIRNNQSGRLMFAEKWPDIANRLFDPQLFKFDHEGLACEEDYEVREELEGKAEDKRDELLEHFSSMEKNLVVYGSLQVKELDKIMSKLDRTVAELIFAERFVDKYFPKAPSSAAATAPSDDSQSAEQSEAPAKKAERPHKENVVVPEIATDSIGHVDHSYNTKAPDYDAPKKDNGNADVDGAASWLDMPEDEFGDVMPISTEQTQAAPEPAAEAAPKTPSMGLQGHQGTQGNPPPPVIDEEEDDKPLFVAGVQPPAPDAVPPPSHQPPETAPEYQAPPSPGAPPLPPVSSSESPSAPPAPPSRPSAPPPSSGMGLKAHQETHTQGQGQAEPPQQQAPQAPPSPGAPPLPPSSPSSSAPPLPGAGNDDPTQQTPPPAQDANAPKKPSLDDIDKHLGNAQSKAPPPLPGSDDKSRY